MTSCLLLTKKREESKEKKKTSSILDEPLNSFCIKLQRWRRNSSFSPGGMKHRISPLAWTTSFQTI